MGHHELEGSFTVGIPGSNVSQVMELVLSIALAGRSPSTRISLALSYMIGDSYTPDLKSRAVLSRTVESARCVDGVWRVQGKAAHSRRFSQIATIAAPSLRQTIEYFKVTEQDQDRYEVSVMGGKPTPLGRRIRAEFEEAFGKHP